MAQPVQEAQAFFSRRNQVRLVGGTVQKQFQNADLARREQAVYRLLEGSALPHAALFAAEDTVLTLSYLPGVPFEEVLRRQEAAGVLDAKPWAGLACWVMEFYAVTGLILTDPNLRNFLYDQAGGAVYGVDFEECAPGSPTAMAAGLCAFAALYRPEETPLKTQLVQLLCREFAAAGLEPAQLQAEIAQAKQRLRARRARR